MFRLRLALLALAVGLGTGCTGIELPALGVAALSTGMGNAVRAGTEYTMTGTAYRTFTLSPEDLATVVRQTLDRMELPSVEEQAGEGRLTFRAEGIERSVRLTLTPISPSLTRLGVSVKQGLVRRDKATASEIITQIEQALPRFESARQ